MRDWTWAPTRRRFVGLLAAGPLLGGAAPPPPQVFLVPDATVGDAAARALAADLARLSGVAVKPLLTMGLADAPTNAAGQLEGDALLPLLQPLADRVRRLYDAPDALVLLVTRRDLNAASLGTRFLFAFQNRATRLAAVSAARAEAAGLDGNPPETALVLTRLVKLLLRVVVEQVLGKPRSSDPAALMYSPLLSVADLDMIGTGI